jgi:hypothetical protein
MERFGPCGSKADSKVPRQLCRGLLGGSRDGRFVISRNSAFAYKDKPVNAK